MAGIDFNTNRINQILFNKITAIGLTPVVSDLFREDAYPRLLNQLLLAQGAVSFVTITSSTPINTTNAETAFGPAAQQFTIPAGALSSAGRILRFRAWGVLGSNGTPTYLFRARLGGIAGSVIAVTHTLTAANNSTAAPWYLEGGLIVRTAGATGVILPENSRGAIANAASGAAAALPSLGNGGVATITPVDLTAAQTLVITVTPSASDAANSVTMTGLEVEIAA